MQDLTEMQVENPFGRWDNLESQERTNLPNSQCCPKNKCLLAEECLYCLTMTWSHLARLKRKEEDFLRYYLPIVRDSIELLINIIDSSFHKFQITVPVGVFEVLKFLKEPPFRYFIQKILLIGWFLFAYNCQISLPPNTRFSNPGSQICNPPSVIDLLRISQLTLCILFWLPLPPFKRKSWRSLDIWAVIDLGARSIEDWKMGRAERIAFIRINLPTFAIH